MLVVKQARGVRCTLTVRVQAVPFCMIRDIVYHWHGNGPSQTTLCISLHLISCMSQHFLLWELEKKVF